MGNDGVVAVERALALLDCFRPGEERLALAGFAARVPLHKTTIYRLLNSLTRAGYVLRQADGSYTLGPRVLYLGRVYERGFRMSDWVMPRLQELSHQTGETATWYVESQGQRLCLFRVQPQEGMHQHMIQGSLSPFDDSSTGQVFRHFGEAGRHALGERAPRLPTFSTGVRDGYTSSLSVPVFGQDDQFMGAMTLSGLADRIATGRKGFAPLLLAQAESLGAALGASAALRSRLYAKAAPARAPAPVPRKKKAPSA
ncbi:MAG: helix-turn-helix domain-containing protein [Burkholderiales bacterium]|nr:helix-turn-helix domain-containing protein [Burkholderiales bacterium]